VRRRHDEEEEEKEEEEVTVEDAESERGRAGEWVYRKEGVGNARRKEMVVRPCGSMKSKATLSPELPPFGNDVFRLPGARGINPICLPPSSRV